MEILQRIDFAPDFVRQDLAGPRILPARLYSASELLDHAADLATMSATLVHDNERRWRVFRKRAEKALPASTEGPQTQEPEREPSRLSRKL